MVVLNDSLIETYVFIQRDTKWEFKFKKFTTDKRGFQMIMIERINTLIKMTITMHYSIFKSKLIVSNSAWSIKK